MKRLLMLIMALAMVSGVTKAQFPSSSKVYVYAKAGEDLKNADVELFAFDGNAIYTIHLASTRIRPMYKKDPSLMSYLKTDRGEYKVSDYYGNYKYVYDSSNSTSARTTYKRFRAGGQPDIWNGGVTADKYYYYSFSKDRTSVIWWESSSNAKIYYTLVDASEFAPKAQNRDFLYE